MVNPCDRVETYFSVKMSFCSNQRTRPRSAPLPTGTLFEKGRARLRGGFWIVNAHAEQKGNKLRRELDTLRKSRNPPTVTSANGEVQTNEEAQVYVHDLHLFVTVQIFDVTLAVLSSGKLCEEHGCTHAWASGQKPHLTKNGKRILCETTFRPRCCPRIVVKLQRKFVFYIVTER